MRLVGVALLCWCVMATGSVVAMERETAATQWLCTDDGELSLRCRLLRAPAVQAATAGQPAAPRRTLPQTLWIPLFNHPFELDHVRQLAQAVLCGSRVDCVARLVGPEQHAPDPADWADFADANDPLLALSE